MTDHSFEIERDASGTYIDYILRMNGVEVGKYKNQKEAERVRDNIKKALGEKR